MRDVRMVLRSYNSATFVTCGVVPTLTNFKALRVCGRPAALEIDSSRLIFLSNLWICTSMFK